MVSKDTSAALYTVVKGLSQLAKAEGAQLSELSNAEVMLNEVGVIAKQDMRFPLATVYKAAELSLETSRKL